jgi:hypothetical protein
MYATAIGLVLKGFEDLDSKRTNAPVDEPKAKKITWGKSMLDNIGKIFMDNKEIDKDL